MRLHIKKLVYGGDGLGRDAEGRTVFVPYVLPGEVVDVAVTGERDGALKSQLVTVERASPARVTAGCRHFGRCGGCQYQHAAYDAQLALKLSILRETLERAGVHDQPEVIVHAGEPWGYRNRIRLRVDRAAGQIRVGYNLRETREFLPIEECPIAAPLLWRAAAALVELGRSTPVGARWLRATAEVELFTTKDERSLQMTLLLREQRSAGFAALCERLRAEIPELVGAGAVVGRGREDVTWGRGGLSYNVDGSGYWVSRGGFFQVNRWMLEELVRVVMAGRNGLRAWDLFAGVGLFSRVLAEGFTQVVAVEANALAVKDLTAMKAGNMRGFAGSVVDFLRSAAVGREPPELVVMDPPRAGVGREVCEILVRMQVPEIVYVSCDPTTLARDLGGMVDSGYNLAELHLVDLFPQTFHLETVAVLQRKSW